ncbi:GFA family protein [Haloferula sp.]|uniref:GFA family protein n=1 Tax=Haloferula sp. TaxID=2497595 RepID=UPI003C72A2BD
MSGILSGGCLCGAVRYEVRGPALQTSVCCCEDCRRASGAPMVAWTFFASGALNWTRGEPKQVTFADRERSFCGDCGTPLMFFDPALPHIFEVSTCSLDEPSKQVPGDVCWVSDELPWAKGIATLERFEHSSPVPEPS